MRNLKKKLLNPLKVFRSSVQPPLVALQPWLPEPITAVQGLRISRNNTHEGIRAEERRDSRSMRGGCTGCEYVRRAGEEGEDVRGTIGRRKCHEEEAWDIRYTNRMRKCNEKVGDSL